MSTLAIPSLAGSRARAADLAQQLPDNLVGSSVVIDTANVTSASQSFVDELCKQVLVVRGASMLVIENASSRFAHHMNTSARLRGVSDRLSVDIRAS